MKHITDTDTVNAVIVQMSKDLESLKRIRKKRSDSGKERSAYKSNLPADYRKYLNRANQKGLAFELTVEQFNQIRAHNCVFCGSSNKIGVDRINSREGYVMDNCQPACGRCNIMKFTLDEEDFLQHILKIFRHRWR